MDVDIPNVKYKKKNFFIITKIVNEQSSESSGDKDEDKIIIEKFKGTKEIQMNFIMIANILMKEKTIN